MNYKEPKQSPSSEILSDNNIRYGEILKLYDNINLFSEKNVYIPEENRAEIPNIDSNVIPTEPNYYNPDENSDEENRAEIPRSI